MMTNSKMSSIFTIYKWNEIGWITKLGIFMFILIGTGACSQDRKKSDNKLPQSAQQSIRAGKTDGKVKVKKAGGATAFILKFYDINIINNLSSRRLVTINIRLYKTINIFCIILIYRSRRTSRRDVCR